MRRSFTAAAVVGAMIGVAQCVRPSATNPPVHSDLVAPPAVTNVLRRACYDCHSNETRWPWYSAIAPVSWVIRRDVNEGRRRLNFSDWADYESDPETAAQKLGQIARSVSNGDMAPQYFLMLHPDARLTNTERDLLVRWAKQASATPPTHN